MTHSFAGSDAMMRSPMREATRRCAKRSSSRSENQGRRPRLKGADGPAGAPETSGGQRILVGKLSLVGFFGDAALNCLDDSIENGFREGEFASPSGWG